MENLKIENSAEAQELLFGLGYRWRNKDRSIMLSSGYLYTIGCFLFSGDSIYYFKNYPAQHITLEELRAYKPMLTHEEVIERLKNSLGVEIERKPNEWVKLTKFDSLKVFCSDYKFRGCER